MGRLATVFRSLREDAAMTQEELAEKAGLSTRTVSDIERGLRTRLYRDTAERLAEALGLAEEARTEFVDLARGRSSDMSHELNSEFRRRFVSWHVSRVAELSGHIGNEEQWFEVLDADEANLTVALRWAEEAGDAEALLQLSTGLFRYWQARGLLGAGRKWLESGLASSSSVAPSTRAAALWGLAWVALHQGDDAVVARCAQELTDLSSGVDDGVAQRNAATLRGIAALARNDIADAAAEFERGLAVARELEQPWLLATSLLNLGTARIGLGETDAARSCIGEALREYEELGDERFRARALGYLGWAALVDGDTERAEVLFAQGLTVFEGVGEGKGIAESLSGLATAAAMQGNAIRAAELAGAAERIRESFAGLAMPVERRLAEAQLDRSRKAAGDEAWLEAWTRGRALRDHEAIELAYDLGPYHR